MSMTDGNLQGQEDTGTEANDEGTETVDQSQTVDQGQQPVQYSNPILNEVDEAHREIVAPYLQKWDAHFTRKMQDVHSEYRPYKELGDVETLSQALQFYSYLEQQPEELYKILHQQFGNQSQVQQQRPGFPSQQPGNQTQFDPSQLPEELAPIAPLFEQISVMGQTLQTYDQRFAQQQRALELIGKYLTGEIQQSRQSQEDQQLAQYLDLLHKENGEFDDQFVITQVMALAGNGAPTPEMWENAIKHYQSVVQQGVNRSRAPEPKAPVVLNGGGSTANQTVDVTKLDRDQTKTLVADVLRRAHEQG